MRSVLLDNSVVQIEPLVVSKVFVFQYGPTSRISFLILLKCLHKI